MSSTLVKTAVCGYHVYSTVWESQVGKEFIVIQERGNSHDSHEMTVYCHNEDPGAIFLSLSLSLSVSLSLCLSLSLSCFKDIHSQLVLSAKNT